MMNVVIAEEIRSPLTTVDTGWLSFVCMFLLYVKYKTRLEAHCLYNIFRQMESFCSQESLLQIQLIPNTMWKVQLLIWFVSIFLKLS